MANYSEAHVCQCLSRLATVRRSSAVTVYGERRKTGLQFVEGVTGLAGGLLQLGVKPGDVVSISALNSDLYLEWMLAITYVGGIAAPLNYRWSLEEARSAMELVRPILLVTDSSIGYWHSKFQMGSVPFLRWHVLMDTKVEAESIGKIFASELVKEIGGEFASVDYRWATERAAIICFTSGTTGKPKGVTITHSALIVQSLAKVAIVRYDEDDVYLHTAPLCHIGGISSAMAVLMAGGSHVILPKFEANLTIEAIKKHNVTSLITVPAMMADLISFNRLNRSSVTYESVKKILNGGGGLSTELTKDAIEIFPSATLLSAYGMTEACSSLTFMTLFDPNKTTHPKYLSSFQGGICVGKLAPHVELKISPDEKSSKTGKILTKGPHVMLGYWGQSPSKSNHSKPGLEGWLDTGDIGQIDEHGNLWLVGRAKDRIKSGGENVYPEEVECVLSQHPGISRIVAIGIPDARLTEIVTACVQLKSGWQWVDFGASQSAGVEQVKCLSSEILGQFCKQKNLTGFKIPKRFIPWEKDFPTTTTGKLRRDRLRVEVMSHTQFVSSKL